MTDERDPTLRPWVAVLVDLVVVVVFVLIGRRTHHEDAGIAGFLRVVWPFVVGLTVAWLVTGLVRRAARVGPRARCLADHRRRRAWPLRIVVDGHDFKVAFTIVARWFPRRRVARVAGLAW